MMKPVKLKSIVVQCCKALTIYAYLALQVLLFACVCISDYYQRKLGLGAKF